MGNNAMPRVARLLSLPPIRVKQRCQEPNPARIIKTLRHKIVITLTETIKTMQQIAKTIEQSLFVGEKTGPRKNIVFFQILLELVSQICDIV